MAKKMITAALLILLSGCSFEREPGPGERIGRALDEMRKGFDELAPDETAEQRREREDREWRRRQDEYYRSHPADSRLNDSSRSTVDLYGDRKPTDAEQEERDREFWSRPPEPRDENDRY